MMKPTPELAPPASKEAIDKGCSCPVLDNHYGRGYGGMEGVFVYNEHCPYHCKYLVPQKFLVSGYDEKIELHF